MSFATGGAGGMVVVVVLVVVVLYSVKLLGSVACVGAVKKRLRGLVLRSHNTT
jgi:hypothetical protein